MPDNTAQLRKLVSEVAAAYFSNTHVSVAQIPDVLDQIAQSLAAVESRRTAALSPEAPRLDARSAPALVHARTTADEIRRSVRRDGLISFEDGRSYRILKRHLTNRGLTPEQYRTKWGLPADYPMVCADSSARRSRLAKQSGLGLKANRPCKTPRRPTGSIGRPRR